jgi:hypothetical protein
MNATANSRLLLFSKVNVLLLIGEQTEINALRHKSRQFADAFRTASQAEKEKLGEEGRQTKARITKLEADAAAVWELLQM